MIAADRMIDNHYHALVASSYGWLLNAKLIVLTIILSIAYKARYTWLSLYSETEEKSRIKQGALQLRKWISIEFIFALLLILLATILAKTAPTKHVVIENWPYLFRFSIDATWHEPNVQRIVWSGFVLILVTLGAIWFGIKNT